MHGAPGKPLYAMLRTEDRKYIRYGPGAEVLYDLEADPDEYCNVAGDEGRRAELEQLRERLLDRMLHAAGTGLKRIKPF